MTLAWIDLRSVADGQLQAVLDATVHCRLHGVVSDDPAVLATLPPTIEKILYAGDSDDTGDGMAIVLREVKGTDQLAGLAQDKTAGAFVDVRDDETLQLAIAACRALRYTVIRFADPTKIPLEIVIAATESATGELFTTVADVEEASIVLDVLQHGPDGVWLNPKTADEVFALSRLLNGVTPALDLATLTVQSIRHDGLGDRVCVDTCSHFDTDEGILVGSYSTGFVLCCSETHPLPYMPTRPFRVNAGALHSYVVGPDNRTSYLSELKSGSVVVGVRADGSTRRIVVGRAKLESRPLLTITAHSEDGREVSLTVQDDWHVRVLGPGGTVLNVTELKQGDQLLGYLATEQRHVGFPIGEFCREK